MTSSYPVPDSWTTDQDLAADYLFSVLPLTALGFSFCSSASASSLCLRKKCWCLTFTPAPSCLLLSQGPPGLSTATSFLLSCHSWILTASFCHLLSSATKWTKLCLFPAPLMHLPPTSFLDSTLKILVHMGICLVSSLHPTSSHGQGYLSTSSFSSAK